MISANPPVLWLTPFGQATQYATIHDMEGFKVFISHSAEDAWVAQQIGRRIREDCGAMTFLDVDDIAVGDNFMQRLHQELLSAQELVALFTPWSARRPWVWIEIGAAWVQKKRVVAVLYGLTIEQFEVVTEGKGIFEELHILQLNDFNRYLNELRSRVAEVNDD